MLCACVQKQASRVASTIKPQAMAECLSNQQVLINKQRVYLNVLDGTPKIYFIHNISRQSFLLNHDTGRSMSVGWGSEIHPGQWSAVLLNTRNFNLTCTKFTAVNTITLDCGKLITACQLMQVDTRKARGEYWLAERQRYSQLLLHLKNRGFKLKTLVKIRK